jgi:hypothetical protein
MPTTWAPVNSNVMFTRLVILTIASFLGANAAAEGDRVYHTPKHSPEKMEELALEFLQENTELVGWCEYLLGEVSFSYTDGDWFLHYSCGEPNPMWFKPGDFFDLSATNDEVPSFKYYRGK